MGDAEELNLLRETYEQALVCSTLDSYLVAGTQPRSEDLERELDARAVLDAARRLYLDACTLP